MRLTFTQDTPIDEQISRSLNRKKKGRKHQHKPSSRKTTLPKGKDYIKLSSIKKRKARIARYWNGEVAQG